MSWKRALISLVLGITIVSCHKSLPTEPEVELVTMLICETYAGDEWVCTERTYVRGTEPKLSECKNPWWLPGGVSPCVIKPEVRKRGVRR